ncbi:MAG: biotin transporter BioY [Oscillospiraceae bacterium]|nr:biotin transporter BioY [Oscillospiraceae bacterium]
MRIVPRRRLRRLTMTAAAAAVMAVLAPWGVAIGPIPITLCTLLIYMMPFVLGPKDSTAAVLVYVCMGVAGLPVFSGFTGGAACLAGPTGGFLLGYPVMALLCTRFAHRGRAAALGGMCLATAVLYALGTLWYCVQTGVGLWAGAAVCVLPCLPGDVFKMAAAAAVGPVLQERLTRAGLRI